MDPRTLEKKSKKTQTKKNTKKSKKKYKNALNIDGTIN